MSTELKPTPTWQTDEYGDVFRTNRDRDGHYGRVGTHPLWLNMKQPCQWGCFPYGYAEPRGFVGGDCASIEEGKRLVEAAFEMAWKESEPQL